MRNLPSKHGLGVIVYACLIPCLVEAIVDVPNGSSDSLLKAAIMNNWETSVAKGTDALLKPRLVKRSTSNIVDIAMFEDSSAPGETFSIYVDDTMSRLIIQVDVEGSNPVMMITKPDSSPGPHPALNTTTGTRIHISTIDTAITATDFGIWNITKMDASKWTVKVQGESPLDFSYQFLEGTTFKISINGDPIQGKNYTAVITVSEFAKIQQIDTVLIFITTQTTLADMLITKDNGSGVYVTSLNMPDQEFMFGIQGKDKSGHFFRRVVLVKPVTLSLIVPSYAGVKLYENSVIDITFYVVNELSKDQDIDVRIADTKKFAQAPIFIAATLTPGQNYTGKFVIKGGQPGKTTVATITARQYLGHRNFSLGPSEVRQFTVERNDTKTTLNTTMTTATTKITSTKSSTTSSATPESPTSNSSTVTILASTAPYIVFSGSVSSTVQPASLVATSPQAGLVPSVANKGTTTTIDENSDSFKKGEVFTAAIASGVASGVLIGVAALVTMALVLRKGIKAKTSVEPEKMEKKNRKFSEYDSKWAIPSKCTYSNNNLTKAND